VSSSPGPGFVIVFSSNPSSSSTPSDTSSPVSSSNPPGFVIGFSSVPSSSSSPQTQTATSAPSVALLRK